MEDNVTILIPSHNRQKYLKRSADYFSTIGYSVYFADSTECEVSDTDLEYLSDRSDYHHLPNLTFIDKILSSLEDIESEYIALCADDDFLFEDALKYSSKILDKDKNISSVIGRHLAFSKPYNGEFFQITKNKYSKTLNGSFSKDIKDFLMNYRQVLWGVYRKATIRKAFEVIKKANLKNDNFIEIAIASICCYEGLKVTEKYFGAREVTVEETWGRRHLPLKQAQGTPEFDEDKRQFIKSVGYEIGENNAELALSSYLMPNKKNSFINDVFFKVYKKVSVLLERPDEKDLINRIIKKHKKNIEGL